MPVNSKFVSVRVSEDALKQRNKHLSMLLDMSTLLSLSMDLKMILPEALSKIMEFFELEVGRIYLMDESGEFLSLAAHRGVDTEGLETVRISEGFSGKAARTKSFIAQHVSDLEDEERGRLLLKKGIKVVICVPLLAAGNVVGVMNLGADQVIDIDQDRIDLLISIGNQIAIAVNNARLYAELDKRVKELKAQKDATEFLAYSIPTTSRAPPWVYSASPGGSTSATATSSGTRPRSIAGRSSGLRSKS
jgi:GAF domain-containing protein